MTAATLAVRPLTLPLKTRPLSERNTVDLLDALNLVVAYELEEPMADAIIAACNAYYAPAGADVAGLIEGLECEIRFFESNYPLRTALIEKLRRSIAALNSLSATRAEFDQYRAWAEPQITHHGEQQLELERLHTELAAATDLLERIWQCEILPSDLINTVDAWRRKRLTATTEKGNG